MSSVDMGGSPPLTFGMVYGTPASLLRLRARASSAARTRELRWRGQVERCAAPRPRAERRERLGV